MKKITSIFGLCFISSILFGFEWPQENIELTSVKSYFGQKRGNSISTSLVFSDPEPVKCIEDGEILIIMTDEQDDSIFFPSALGTSVIISHEDSLLSVYGNLDKNSVKTQLEHKEKINSGYVIGDVGNSGWQNGTTSLEFQIIDSKEASAINPKILITRTNNELPLTIENLMLENKNGNKFALTNQKSFQSGLYRIYQKRNPIASPYRTLITINGVVVDQISYDTINQENNKLYVVGKKKYIDSDIYPDDDLQLIGETMFTAGKSTLGLLVNDILGNQTMQTYIVNVY